MIFDQVLLIPLGLALYLLEVTANHTLDDISVAGKFARKIRNDNISSDHVIVRNKRQLGGISCPIEEARGSDISVENCYLLIYSPERQRYSRIERNSRGWIKSDLNQLEENGFNPTLPTLLYSHAYFQGSQAFWLQEVRRTYKKRLEREEPRFNLIIFDWADYSMRSYKQSVSFVPHLGRALAQFLNELSDRYRYNISQVHMISYSLGAHVVGMAGREIKRLNGQKVSKITALDPTGVCLHFKSSFADKYALRASDAELVVARHYDMGTLGSRRSIGGVDIFVNGGSNQPNGRSKRQSGLIYRSGGSHARTVEHEMDQDGRDKCYEVAYACRDRAAFLKGECGDCGRTGEKCYYIHVIQETLMKSQGIRLNEANYRRNTSMFLETKPEAPFCLYHYQVVVVVKPDISVPTRRLFERGLVTIELSFNLGVKPKNLFGEQRYTNLVLSNRHLGTLSNRLKIKVEGNQGNEMKNISNSIELVEINYLSHVLPKQKALASGRYICDQTNDDLKKLKS